MMFPATPAPFTIAPDHAAEICRRIEEFFGEIIKYLQVGTAQLEYDAEIITRGLCFESPGAVNPTDDRLTLLVIQGHVVASVIDRRTATNYCQVTFASYLTPDLLRAIGFTAVGIKLLDA